MKYDEKRILGRRLAIDEIQEVHGAQLAGAGGAFDET